MLIPRTFAFTTTQRLLIIGAIVSALVSLGALVYSYERYHRGPSDSVFFGTWETPSYGGDESPMYFQFKSDQTFLLGSEPSVDEESAFATGRWYAGGPNIYVRFSADLMGPTRPEVWHIEDIAPDVFRIRFDPDSKVVVYRRVRPAATPASNHAMQRTAGRSAFPLSMISTFNLQPRALSPAVADLVSR
ncbi:MAG: hypothetical protein ACR2HH_05130 [Chthoniobacterales bacterium]